ncbi:hypothetical protein CAEBREN_21457 [Caenorhabditis brenneri]|uniref:PAN-3 domain-containing protein n=1 Tax=Caenorhabditis brenneri TaxID=135651 RepID=G0NMB2_CAEBE|nr:hypothetical protein CAEBREN_21457 [Caenorhabditis brenneri]
MSAAKCVARGNSTIVEDNVPTTTTEKYEGGCMAPAGPSVQVAGSVTPFYSKEELNTFVCMHLCMYERKCMLSIFYEQAKNCQLFGVAPLELIPLAKLPDGSVPSSSYYYSSPCNTENENTKKGIYTLSTGESFQLTRIGPQNMKFVPIS